MGFELQSIRPFLERVAGLVSSFGPAEMARVLGLVDELEGDEERDLHFEVGYDGCTLPLRISVFLDGVDAVDLYFFTVPKLAAEIQRQMDELHGAAG
jgi:hypothetical protein